MKVKLLQRWSTNPEYKRQLFTKVIKVQATQSGSLVINHHGFQEIFDARTWDSFEVLEDNDGTQS